MLSNETIFISFENIVMELCANLLICNDIAEVLWNGRPGDTLWAEAVWRTARE
jgi:hypothetical protein